MLKRMVLVLLVVVAVVGTALPAMAGQGKGGTRNYNDGKTFKSYVYWA